MKNQAPVKEIVSVTEMSRMCRLSRARFYQLIGEGIFPEPSRNEQTGRPFFSCDQQEQCLLIRHANKGANGKALIFYGCRLDVARPQPRKRSVSASRKRTTRQDQPDPAITTLCHGLAQLGMPGVADRKVRAALADTYPDGHRDVDSAELLRVVFGELQRRDSTDNVSG